MLGENRVNNVLIIGAGGREHAIARAFAKSPQVQTVYVAPGNPGMILNDEKIECVNIQVTDIELLAEFVANSSVALTFVGPEQPLELGIVDYLNELNYPVVGPTKEAAKLENSKNFAKEIMAQANVQTAKYRFFQENEYSLAVDYINGLGLPLVIKADGLMSGKGVVIPETMDEALETLDTMMQVNAKAVLIEEFLTGTEFSHFSLVNGSHVIPIGTACDYKRTYDNDMGLNTGGMGSFAPVPWFDKEIESQLINGIVQPVADQMVANNTPFTGIIYSGVILTNEGPKVIEFNTRFGDPETQVLLSLIENDFYDVIQAHLTKAEIDISLKPGFNLGIVLAAKGYPAQPVSDILLEIPETLTKDIYYAGVSEDEDSNLLSKGGRILMVTSSGETLDEARDNAYKVMNQIEIKDTFYRNDIGLHREKEA